MCIRDRSIRGKIPEQMDADVDKVFGRIEKNGGMLPFTDKMCIRDRY